MDVIVYDCGRPHRAGEILGPTPEQIAAESEAVVERVKALISAEERATRMRMKGHCPKCGQKSLDRFRVCRLCSPGRARPAPKGLPVPAVLCDACGSVRAGNGRCYTCKPMKRRELDHFNR